MAELRHDKLRQRWIAISDKLGKRPSDFQRSDSQQRSECSNPGPCAFCHGFEHLNGHETFAIRDGDQDDAPDWRVRVIVNKYPAVSMDYNELQPTGEGTVYDGCRLPGFGSHEVIIETPNHLLNIPELPATHIAEVLKAYQARINFFQSDSRFKFCQVFKNRGNRAGASMTHSHSQLIALPVVTHNKISELRGAQEYYDKHKQCLLCDVVQHDTQSNRSRLIDEDEHFVTIAPYAPMFPYETLLVPKRHSSNYESIGEDEIQAMARMLKLTLRKMDLAFGYPPYNYTLQTVPLGKEYNNSPHYHWYLDILPHLATPGGFELGSGCYINPVYPEKAAEFLRNLNIEP
jgi:UDPglucose--hexose-1-phosphate uridylyltransferase